MSPSRCVILIISFANLLPSIHVIAFESDALLIFHKCKEVQWAKIISAIGFYSKIDHIQTRFKMEAPA